MESKGRGWRVQEESAVGRLARFFPEATPLRIPVTLSRRGAGHLETEATVIEFGTAREALFASGLALEFADKVFLQNVDRSFETEAWVVALQYHNGHAAVAARFVREMPQWVVTM